MVEYNCSAVFTDFIADELLPILSRRHKLSIAATSQTTAIVGYSASGLAAFYAGMTRAYRFGQVIAQSPSLEILKKSELRDLMTKSFPSNSVLLRVRQPRNPARRTAFCGWQFTGFKFFAGLSRNR